jgi:hypothetical protein
MQYRKSIIGVCLFFTTAQVFAQTQARTPDQEVYTPVPAKVRPGAGAGQPPSDAVILFDGKSLSEWERVKDGGEPLWPVGDGVMTVNKKEGTIRTKRKFLDYQLHLEWRVPLDIKGDSQARGNSGVIMASTGPNDNGYELQILDSYDNSTYTNGQAGAIYRQYIPLVNPCLQPGQWQTYDIIWIAPRFTADGRLVSPARATVLFNGILVQHDVALSGPTATWPDPPGYRVHGASAIKLQAHGDPSAPISFRNIWLRELVIQ